MTNADVPESKLNAELAETRRRLAELQRAKTEMERTLEELRLSERSEQSRLRQRIAELEGAVAECRRMESIIRELSQFRENVIDNANVWLDVLDAEANVVVWNKAAERISGYSREEVVGHNKIWRWLYPDKTYREQITSTAQAIIHQNKVVEDFETCIRTKDGRHRIIAWYSRNLVDENGEVIGSVALGRDITEQKEAQEELRRAHAELEDRVQARTAELRTANERLRQEIVEREKAEKEREQLFVEASRRAAELQGVLNSIVDVVYVCDVDGRLVLANGAGLRLLGAATIEEANRRREAMPRQLNLRHPDGRPVAPQEMPESRALKGETLRMEHLIVCDPVTGRDVDIRASAAPIRDEKGRIVGAVIVAKDVTELVELDRMKDDFIRVAAHELKTPVAIMKGYAQVLSRAAPGLTEPQRKMLDAVNRGADRIDRIIGDLLDISRLQLGHLELARERVDVHQLVQEAVDRTAVMNPKHRIRVVRATPVVVQGDRDRLQDMTMQLLENAVKYSPGGGDIDVAVDLLNDEATVSVTDHGVGIPRAKQARIFERFYRAHTGTPYDYGGMGVGLYIAKEIIQDHGGRMWFDSEEGRGSTFRFSLPVKNAGRSRSRRGR